MLNNGMFYMCDTRVHSAGTVAMNNIFTNTRTNKARLTHLLNTLCNVYTQRTRFETSIQLTTLILIHTTGSHSRWPHPLFVFTKTNMSTVKYWCPKLTSISSQSHNYDQGGIYSYIFPFLPCTKWDAYDI